MRGTENAKTLEAPLRPGDFVVIEYPDGHESKGCVLDGRPSCVIAPLAWRQDGDDAYVVSANTLLGSGETVPRGLVRSDAPVRRWRKGEDRW